VSKVLPITPSDVRLKIKDKIPEFVLEVFNALIVKNWRNGTAIIRQEEALELICQKIGTNEAEVFANGWLNVEHAYRGAGWSVIYDKPGPGETYEPFFSFRPLEDTLRPGPRSV